MGAHEAGRVACHASSPEWAVKSATCTYLSIETAAFVGAYFYFTKHMRCFYTTWPLFGGFLLFTLILQLLQKIASHPLLHTASAFEVCCHVALRHVL